jgi:hypothetical protein
MNDSDVEILNVVRKRKYDIYDICGVQNMTAPGGKGTLKEGTMLYPNASIDGLKAIGYYDSIFRIKYK